MTLLKVEIHMVKCSQRATEQYIVPHNNSNQQLAVDWHVRRIGTEMAGLIEIYYRHVQVTNIPYMSRL